MKAFEKPLNMRTVKTSFKRIELCDLLLACTVLSEANEGTSKWDYLHDRIKKIIDEFDSEQEF